MKIFELQRKKIKIIENSHHEIDCAQCQKRAKLDSFLLPYFENSKTICDSYITFHNRFFECRNCNFTIFIFMKILSNFATRARLVQFYFSYFSLFQMELWMLWIPMAHSVHSSCLMLRRLVFANFRLMWFVEFIGIYSDFKICFW